MARKHNSSIFPKIITIVWTSWNQPGYFVYGFVCVCAKYADAGPEKSAEARTAHKTIYRRNSAVNLSSVYSVVEGRMRDRNRRRNYEYRIYVVFCTGGNNRFPVNTVSFCITVCCGRTENIPEDKIRHIAVWLEESLWPGRHNLYCTSRDFMAGINKNRIGFMGNCWSGAFFVWKQFCKSDCQPDCCQV